VVCSENGLPLARTMNVEYDERAEIKQSETEPTRVHTYNIRAFLEKVDMTCDNANVDEATRIRLTRLALLGKAGTWASTLARTARYDDDVLAVLEDWTRFKNALLDRWSQKKSPEALATLVRGLVMRANESIEDFWDRCYFASVEVNYRRTEAEMRTALYKAMQCEFMQLHCIDGLPSVVRNALPALDEKITMSDLRKEVVKAYDKVKRDGFKIGPGSTKDQGTRGVKEVAGIEMSDKVAGLTKKFAKWATAMEKNSKLDQANFSVQHALTGQQPKAAEVAAVESGGSNVIRGGGRGRGRGGSGRRGNGGNTGPQNLANVQCFRCKKYGHYSQYCPEPYAAEAQPGQGTGASFGGGRGAPQGVNSVSYAQVTQAPPVQGQFHGTPQQQVPQGQMQGQGQAGAAPFFNSQWDFPQ
jgi:hypothetical protein